MVIMVKVLMRNIEAQEIVNTKDKEIKKELEKEKLHIEAEMKELCCAEDDIKEE